MRALAINTSLKGGANPAPSSTQRMLDLIAGELARHDVATDFVRAVDLDIKPGVTADEGEGDEWPSVREKLLRADMLVLGTPIWLGQPSSVCKRVLERMDAFLSDTDDQGRMVTYNRVGMVAIVGNEDGAHHISAELYQALNDVGFSLAPNAVAYWVGEAMGSIDFTDLEEIPEKVGSTISMMCANAVHIAQLLKADAYPPQD